MVANLVDSLEYGLLLLDQLLGLQCLLLVVLSLFRLDHGHIRGLHHELVNILSIVGVGQGGTCIIGCRSEHCSLPHLLHLLHLLLHLLLIWV